MVDCMGSGLVVGEYVAYVLKIGNSPELRLGKILETKENSIKVRSIPYGKTSSIESWWCVSSRLVALQFHVPQSLMEKLDK